jgi:hypothetical protein
MDPLTFGLLIVAAVLAVAVLVLAGFIWRRGSAGPRPTEKTLRFNCTYENQNALAGRCDDATIGEGSCSDEEWRCKLAGGTWKTYEV